MRLRICMLLLLTVVWLLPLFGAGTMGWIMMRSYPRFSFQHSVPGMFTMRTGVWAQMHIQVQWTGMAEWKTIDSAELSPMGCFGYRQRLDRILQETQGRPFFYMTAYRLAAWVARRYEQLHPGKVVTGVRFGQMIWTANTPELAMPSGHCVPNSPDEGPSAPFHPFATFVTDKGVPRLITDRPPSTPTTAAGIGKRFQRPTPKRDPGEIPSSEALRATAMPFIPEGSKPRTP